ncbi:MBG domain-containing protein [Novosphingobium sp.]|uniref:MBG domain-containing protein n=1 Tax=Novosphingobium sp. TaxID=1874826 RepID=UPI003D11D9A5
MNRNQIGTAPRGQLFASSMLARGLILALSTFASVAHAGTLPTGGAVAAGSATIATSPASVVVTQASDRAIINWTGFSVGQGNTITFNQPGATSATLNRVTGATTSTIAGQIVSNGAVYLINPNGIAITATGSVDTAGGFIASTLDIADSDFMAGRANFAGKGASASVSNAGRIVAGQGAYVALLGGSVANAGTITVPLGKVGLASGEQVTLDLNGNGFMQVALPTNTLTGTSALIDNSGTITVNGGFAQLSAATVKNAVRNVINMSGVINADSATGSAGHIQLWGGDGGTVAATGTLTARATGAAGDGGLVETSGAAVDFTGLKVNTSSIGGKTGTWLVDPYGLIVDTASANTISANLATTDVALTTTGGNTTGPGIPITDPYAGASVVDINAIYINAPISWSSQHELYLGSGSDIIITAAINGPNGSLVLNTNELNPSPAAATYRTISDTAAVNVGLFQLREGNWVQNTPVLPAFYARDFQIAPNPYYPVTFLRVSGGSGTTSNPYQVADVYGLQGITGQDGSRGSLGIVGPVLLTGSYVLTNDIDASVTATWNGGTGFVPIGTIQVGFTIFSSPFTGTLDGQGHTISGLVVNNFTGLALDNLIGYRDAGLFGQIGQMGQTAQTAAVANLTLSGASVTDQSSNSQSVGVLAGAVVDATITNVHTSGSAIGVVNAGGLIGSVGGSVLSNTSSSASVSAQTAGGLVGTTTSATRIGQSYATGAVSAVYTGGGLVGSLDSGSNVTQAYASGSVTGTPGGTGFEKLGGLVGAATSATIEQAYATGSVTGSVAAGSNIDAGGLVGTTQGSTIAETYATGAVNSGTQGTENAAGGLVGNLLNSTVTASYWDMYSSGRNLGAGLFGTGTFLVTTISSDPAQFGTLNYAYNTSAYATFGSANWVFFNGQTRPFGAWELPAAVNGVVTITNSHQLQLISSALGQDYVLGNTIDLSETGAVVAGNPSSYQGMWNSTGFVSIGITGTTYSGFTGILDGHGFAISNMSITSNPLLNGYIQYDAGLFEYLTSSANISNLNLVGGVIDFPVAAVGALAGQNSGTISNVTSSTTVIGSDIYTGGLVGYNVGYITGSSASGPVTGVATTVGSAYSVGGLVGYNQRFNIPGDPLYANSGVITQSFATGSVTGAGGEGGLVGTNDNGIISQSYASGTVHSTISAAYTGGLVAQNYGSITDSYATGAVTGVLPAVYVYNGLEVIGGLIGANYGPVTRSYATGLVAGGEHNLSGLASGGLAGYNSFGTFTGTFWDTTSTGQTNAVYNAPSPTGTAGLTTAQMQNFGAYASTYAGWNFVNVWAPPTQAGQAGQTAGYYPQLYATSPVILATAAITSSTYGAVSTTPGVISGGPGIYAFGPSGDAIPLTSLFTTTVTASSGVGQYATTPLAVNSVTSTLGTAYRVINPGVSGSITIDPALLTLTYTANPTTGTYGAAIPALSGSDTVTGLVNGDTLAAVIAGTPRFSTGATPTSNAGSYAVTGSGLSGLSANYSLMVLQAPGNATALTINPAPLTVTYTANSATGTYGSAIPALSGSESAAGLVNNDTLASVTSGLASFGTSATSASNVGNYGVTGSGLSANSGNYSVTFQQAASNANALTINPAPLTVTYTANAATGTYGSAIPALSGSESAVGLVNNDTLASATLGTASFATSATSASNAGSYGVTGNGLSGNGNYSVTFQQAAGNAMALTINPAPLNVTYTANTATGTYGSAIPALSGTESAAGLVNNDTLASATLGTASFGTSATSASNAGSYGVTGSGLSGNGNYTVTAQQAAGNATALTINPAALTVTYTANAAIGTYGSAIPALSGSESAAGLVNGDTLAAVTSGAASYGSDATRASNVGSYGVTGSGLSGNSGNYSVTFQQAAGNVTALTINPAPLTVTYTANAVTGTYGAAIPALSGTESATGLVNGDTLSSATMGTAGFGTSATSASNVGSYGVTGGGLSGTGNYTVTAQQAAGNATALTINPAALIVTYTANAATGTYGAAIPALSGTETGAGLVNGDTVASVTSGTASFATSATPASNVGSYGVVGSGLSGSSANYTVTFQQAMGNASAFTIDPRSVTVMANSLDRPFGAPNPQLTYVIAPADATSGLIDGATLSGALATTANQQSPSGNYAITQGTLAATSNYRIAYIAGVLKVDLPPLQALNAFINSHSPAAWLWGDPAYWDAGCAAAPPPHARSETIVITDPSRGACSK